MLRLLALLAMVIDHAGLALFPRMGIFRCVGRIAFPLYCFLIVQGYVHTHDRRAYIRRLLLLAFLSEIPFDLLIFGRVASVVEQNVLFSLLLGLLALYVADMFTGKPLYATAGVLGVLLAAMMARVSFGWLGPALCVFFYKAQDSRLRQAAGMVALEGIYALSLLLSGVAFSWVLVSLSAMLAAVPVLFYNGKRGPRVPVLTFLFYAAYPVHLTALVIVRELRIIPPYFFI